MISVVIHALLIMVSHRQSSGHSNLTSEVIRIFLFSLLQTDARHFIENVFCRKRNFKNIDRKILILTAKF